MAKVTGIGGVFFKARSDATALSKWYQEHLGIELESWGGGILDWRNDTASDGGMTVWTLAAPDSQWFEPGTSPFMINYRIDDMAGMVRQLKAAGVEILKGPDAEENGQFLWIMDPDGNKVELWEPKLWEDAPS